MSSATIAALAEVAQGAVTASMGSGLFAVSCRSEVLNRVRRFPGVASLRVRTPADKRAALALPVDQQATYSRNLSPLDNGPVHVRCPCTWPSQSCASRISSVFEAHLCAATSSRAPHHKVVGVYPAPAAAAASAAVAALVEVDCVEELLPFASLDFATKQILWNASNDIMDSSHVSSLNGSGQVIAIADTGLGTSSCFSITAKQSRQTTPTRASTPATCTRIGPCAIASSAGIVPARAPTWSTWRATASLQAAPTRTSPAALLLHPKRACERRKPVFSGHQRVVGRHHAAAAPAAAVRPGALCRRPRALQLLGLPQRQALRLQHALSFRPRS